MAEAEQATEKQIAYLLKLAKVNGFSVEVENLTKKQASSVISCLFNRNWHEPKMWNVRPLLRRM